MSREGTQSAAAAATPQELPDADRCQNSFQMPLHYPRFTRADYEAMPEWKLDSLLREYGLPTSGDLRYKREFAIGCFLWSN
ncbi:hypothetical protein BT93_E0015 [Corymbia citriodora subsp. variegata]|nr:hypothetical protein BT93_E0015 [Corymbia citriodora subsp. variegata]